MDQKQAKELITKLQTLCSEIYEIAKKANRNKKSLSGDNFYGNKFHTTDVEITKTEKLIQPILGMIPTNDTDIKTLKTSLETLRSTTIKPPQKGEALKQIKRIVQAKLLPTLDEMTANPIPTTEHVFPLEILKDGRLKKLAQQINGCYEHQWYDASAVMMRRFTEILIIESYIKNSKAHEVKDANGDFLMLRDLVKIMTNDSFWELGRHTKPGLPEIKELGDLAAHNRTFMVAKKDIDKVIKVFNIVIRDLLHQAGHNIIDS